MKVEYFCSCFLLFVPAKNPAQSVPISTPQTIGTLGSIATAAAALLRRVMKPWKPEKNHRVDACRFLKLSRGLFTISYASHRPDLRAATRQAAELQSCHSPCSLEVNYQSQLRISTINGNWNQHESK